MKKTICLLLALFFLLIPLTGCGSSSKKQQEIYEQAIKAIDDYEYAEAVNLLNQIPAYKDSQEKIKEAQNGELQAKFANYVFNFIKDGSFYNPSAARVLDASYEDSDGYYAKTLEADGILYLRIQGTNKFGGTLNKEYVIVIGGEYDGKAFSNEDSGKNYKLTDEEIDVPTINKMLIKYWADYGL